MDKIKIDRKALKRPDAFVEKGRSVLDYLAEQRMRIIPLGIAVLVILIAAYGYDSWSGRQLDKAWTAYYVATKQSEPQKWEELKKVHHDWSNNRATYFSAVNLADHYFDEARKQALKGEAPKENPTFAAQAAEWYGKALNFKDLLPGEKQLLEINRGESLEIDKKYDEAMAEYKKAADQGGDVKPYAQLQVARAWELKNDKNRAIEIYEKLAADAGDSEFGKMAKSQLRLLKSPLFQSANKM